MKQVFLIFSCDNSMRKLRAWTVTEKIEPFCRCTVHDQTNKN